MFSRFSRHPEIKGDNTSVAEPDPGSGMNKSGSGSGMNSLDHISDSLETIFGLKYFNPLMRIRDGKSSDPGWEKFRSGINIPDPQHWIIHVRLCCRWGCRAQPIPHWQPLPGGRGTSLRSGGLSLPPFVFVWSGIQQCCGSGMVVILDPQHCWSPDLKQQQKRGVKRNLLSYHFCS